MTRVLLLVRDSTAALSPLSFHLVNLEFLSTRPRQRESNRMTDTCCAGHFTADTEPRTEFIFSELKDISIETAKAKKQREKRPKGTTGPSMNYGKLQKLELVCNRSTGSICRRCVSHK